VIKKLIATADIFHKGEVIRVGDGRGHIVETWRVRWAESYQKEPPKDEVCFDIKGYRATEHL